MSGIRYAATFSGTSFAGVSVSAAQDLFYILASSGVPVRLHRLSLSTAGQTSPGNLIISVQRFTPTVTAGSGGTLLTPVELAQVSGRAASSTVRANDTTRATTTGSKQVLWAGTMQDLNNLDDVLVPELWPMISAGTALVVGLEVAPGSAVNLFGAVHFSELA
ncbi:MAG: hypothetical protein ACREFJ_13835 [Acetobacteraceae bacterium]